MIRYSVLASTYGSGSYNEATYSAATQATTATNGTSNGSGTLANTGFDILLISSIACALMFTAIVVHVIRRPGRQAS